LCLSNAVLPAQVAVRFIASAQSWRLDWSRASAFTWLEVVIHVPP
jgi:hypothetical protein